MISETNLSEVGGQGQFGQHCQELSRVLSLSGEIGPIGIRDGEMLVPPTTSQWEALSSLHTP